PIRAAWHRPSAFTREGRPVQWRRLSRWGIVGATRTAMSQLNSKKRAQLPKSAFAYVDSRGRKRLPINDESHVRNALARFNQVIFEDEAARERARTRLLNAAKKYGIVPVGFMTGQLQSQMSEAVAGRLVIELGQVGTPGEFERRLRSALRDPTLSVLHWSESAGAYLDGAGRPATLPGDAADRAVTLLERQGERYAPLLAQVSAIIRNSVGRVGGREVDARADEFLAVFDRAPAALKAALEIERGVQGRAWPDDVGVRIRIGIHRGRPTLTDAGYVGLAVHTVARICSAGHGGQILLSAAARDGVG